VATAASAQQASPASNGGPTALSEIIVTAQKKSEKLQDTPLAVTAETGEQLAERQVKDVAALAQMVPNVNFGQSVGIARISIRGIGFSSSVVGSEAPTAYHLDGVYISRPVVVYSTFFDVDRVETVRGPQGTVYGRNATAGAVNVITRNPTDEPTGYLNLAYGNYDMKRVEGAVGGPLGGGVTGRLAFTGTARDGYGRNLFTGQELDNQYSGAARAKLMIRPTDSMSLLLSADYFHEADRANEQYFFGAGSSQATPAPFRFGFPPVAERVVNTPVDPKNKRIFYGGGAEFNWKLSPDVTLTSITGYRSSKVDQRSELAEAPVVLFPLDFKERSRSISEELRLAGRADRLDWLAGAYYFHENLEGGTILSPVNRLLLGSPVSSLSEGLFLLGAGSTSAYAAFGQATYHITQQLSVDLGARYSSEHKTAQESNTVDFGVNYSPSFVFTPAPEVDRSGSWSSFTPKVSLNYKFTPEVLGYVSYSRGFKSGGFALSTLGPPFAPEELDDYEGGLKGDWLNGHLRTDVAAFYYKYSNLQVQKLVGTTMQIVNAARATIKGAEAEVTALPTDNLQVDLNVALLDAKYDSFVTGDPAEPQLGPLDLAGHKLPQAPDYKVNLGVQYTAPLSTGKLTFRGEGVWVGKQYFSPYNKDANYQSLPPNAKFNAFATYRADNGFSLSLFGRNLTNKTTYYATVASSLTGSAVIGTFDPPRTYGVELGYQF
jgi:iron complex outermembrane receptor protein